MIKILEPGLYSSIQDEGREDFQKYGVPFLAVWIQNHIILQTLY